MQKIYQILSLLLLQISIKMFHVLIFSVFRKPLKFTLINKKYAKESAPWQVINTFFRVKLN